MSACRGGTLLLTYADKRGRGGQKSENLADIICEHSLIYPLISRCENLNIMSNNLPYFFLQSKIFLWKILFVEIPKNANSFSIPQLIPLNDFSKIRH